jgi:two-component system, NarL family, nitrate/nitrite response regulator NarL
MRLVLCDDNRILCEALGFVLEARGHKVLAITTRANDAVAAVAAHHPDACLLDLRLPDGNGLDAAREIRRHQPETKIVVLSCLADPAAFSAANKIGIAGYLRKDQKANAIAGALDVIGSGGTAHDVQFVRRAGRTAGPNGHNPLELLTPRETEVLQRIVAGQKTSWMACEMNIATSTMRSYVKSILAKLGAHSRLQAAAIARRALATEHSGSDRGFAS